MKSKSLQQDIENIIKDDLSFEDLKPWAQQASILLQGLEEDISKLFAGDWPNQELPLLLREENDLLDKIKTGYMYVNKIRELVTGDEVIITIGSVTKSGIYYQKGVSEETLLNNAKLSIVHRSNFIKLMSDVKKSQLSDIKTIKFDNSNNSNDPLSYLYNQITQTEIRTTKKGKQKRVNKYGLNKGHIFELMYKAVMEKYTIDELKAPGKIQALIADAKQNLPFYKGGDYENIQLKARGTFSISLVLTIYKVLKWFCAIVNSQNDEKVKQNHLNILFSPQTSTQVTHRILNDAYKEAENDIKNMIGVFLTEHQNE